jgi:hypothetical protein
VPGSGGLPAPVFFLKQFRAADSSSDACYQKTLTGALIVDQVHRGGLLTGQWQLDLTHTDSLPFVRELGLGSPTDGKLVLSTDIGLWANVDFTVGLASEF